MGGACSNNNPPENVPIKELSKIPNGIIQSTNGSDLVIAWRWFSKETFALVAFNLILYYLLYSAIAWAINPNHPSLSSIIVTITLFLILCVLFTYGMIAGFVNRTEIRISSISIVVQHSPLLWPGKKVVSISEVDSIYFSKRIKENSTYCNNAIVVSLKHSKDVILVAGVRDPEYVRYIIKEIEQRIAPSNI